MRLLSRSAVQSLLLFLSLGSIVACSSAPKVDLVEPPPSSPRTKEEALEREVQRVNQAAEGESRKDLIDLQLRLASMALDARDQSLARETLIEATRKMSGEVDGKAFLRHEKEALKKFGGVEEEKYFLGDPYEQFLAYVYLGILDFQAGDYELARASFRSAIIADTNTTEDLLPSDSYFAFMMEGFCNKALEEEDQARECFRLASEAYSFRTTMPILAQALYLALGQMIRGTDTHKIIQRLDCMFPLVFVNIPSSLSVYKDPYAAVEHAFASARAALDEPDKSPLAEEFLKSFEWNIKASAYDTYNYLKRTLKNDTESESPGIMESLGMDSSGQDKKTVALYMLDRFQERVRGALEKYDFEKIKRKQDRFDQYLKHCLQEKTNVLMVHQIGQGPWKTRTGKYAQMVQFHTPRYPERRVLGVLARKDGATSLSPCVAFQGEDVSYQAKTRGGREMDHLLEGRAEFRDAMYSASMLAAGTSSAALAAASVGAAMTAVGISTLSASVTLGGVTYSAWVSSAIAAPAAALAVGSLVAYHAAKAIGDAVHPEGDIRGWYEIPDALLLSCASLEPGAYEVTYHTFDRLGKWLEGVTCKKAFEAPSTGITLLLTGSPWGPNPH